MGAVVGIDLGTTNTVVAAIRDGRPTALPDESGSTLIPSIVSFLPSGAVLVGNAAKERRSQDARNTIYSVKRLIGRTWDSGEVREATTRFPFELREGPGRATFVIARGETYTLPEISAFVLRKAKSIAELELGEPVDRAVITVPANFNDLQRAATKVAGRVAGLEVLRILNEPTAAALAFGHTRGNRERIAIYDFGGGTFDLTLLLLTDDVFEVLATAGDTFLGGDDIDSAIVERMARQLSPDLVRDPRTQPDTLERLRAAAEHVKLELSESPDARIFLDDNEVGDPRGLDFTLSRDELESIVEPIARRTFKVCHDALTMAKLVPKDIDHVLLVGGTTRIPLVKHRVEEYFGKRARADLDPHEVVALGAAQQAMALTQLRATASGIPVAPPPRRAFASSSNEPVHEQDLAQQRQNQAKVADDPARQKTDPYGHLRKQTDPGVGDAEESVKPGRVSVVPPDGPLSHPAPTTQSFSHRERRTTGVGIGPTEASLPLVGVEPAAKAHEALEIQTAPSTLSPRFDAEPDESPVAQHERQASQRELEDLPVPLVPTTAQHERGGGRAPAATRRDFTRAPTVRVTRGTGNAPDLTATLSSAIEPSDQRTEADSSPSTDPLFGAVVRPADSAKADSSPSTDPLFGAAARPTASAKVESSPSTNPLFGGITQPNRSLRDAPAIAPTGVSPSPQGKSPRETLPDEVGPWDAPPDNAVEFGLPIVTATTRLTPERRVVTKVSQDPNQASPQGRHVLPTAASDPIGDLPLVVAHSARLDSNAAHAKEVSAPTTAEVRAAFAKTENSEPSRLGLPEPDLGDDDDDAGADEPTVIRRSVQNSSVLADDYPALTAEDNLPERVAPETFDNNVDEPAFLPTAASYSASASTGPATPRRASKLANLNEDEIRARYGNLPLIVGGKRVGTRAAESAAEPERRAGSRRPLASTAEGELTGRAPPNLPAVPPGQLPRVRTETRDPNAANAGVKGPDVTLEESSRQLGTITKRPNPPLAVPAPLPAPRPSNPTAIPSLEPEALEPEYVESELLESPSRPSATEATPLEAPSPDETVPKSQRLHSTRPSARQDVSVEFELPIPDLPPQRPAPTAARPVVGSTRPLPTTRQPLPEPSSGMRPDAVAGRSSGKAAPTLPLPQVANNPGVRNASWGESAALTTLPLGVAGLTTDAWQPPTPTAAVVDPYAPAPSQPQTFEVPSLLASLPKSASLRPALLIDVTPLSLCVETVGGYVDTLIARNSPVPCERTRDFVTAHDNQQSVIVRVSQGESKQFQENVLLGEVQLSGIPAAPRGQSRIAVTFGIDSDGILHVRALDVMSGQSALADLRLQGAPTSPEVAQMMARHAAKGHA